MKWNVLKEDNFIESQWAGGSTKQLYIFPEDATYTERNFLFRLSTAKVETPESTFSSLPGFMRKLMILDGGIVIKHENHHSKTLKPFDIDTFSGEWNTKSVGTCVDFNVMTAGSIESELTSMILSQNRSLEIFLDQKWTMLFLYLLDGSIELSSGLNSFILQNGDLGIGENFSRKSISAKCKETARIVVVKIGSVRPNSHE